MSDKTRLTVVETPEFIARAKGRMSEAEVRAAIDALALAPEAGVLLKGTGGIRKMRFAVGAKGKSGGVRVVYYFYNRSMPLFMLSVFAKNEQANLSAAQRNALAKLAELIRETYGN
jgi:hypothetical protein